MFSLGTRVRSLSTTSFLLCLVVLYLVPVAIKGEPSYIFIQSLTCEEYMSTKQPAGTWESLGSLEECSDAGKALEVDTDGATKMSQSQRPNSCYFGKVV